MIGIFHVYQTENNRIHDFLKTDNLSDLLAEGEDAHWEILKYLNQEVESGFFGIDPFNIRP
jgi:hypothetical protein